MAAGAAAAISRAEADEQAAARHERRIGGHALRNHAAGGRVDEGRGGEASEESCRLHGLSAGTRWQQTSDDAAHARNATMKEHEHRGRQSDKHATYCRGEPRNSVGPARWLLRCGCSVKDAPPQWRTSTNTGLAPGRPSIVA